MAELKYPIGIQTFSEIIEGGYAYVDKTRYVGELTTRSKYVFLSRPRRFGKSLLASTLHCYFDGRRDLFKGLALDSMDVDWTPHPVLHFDFNNENYEVEDAIYHILDKKLRNYEKEYGRNPEDGTPANRLESLIKNAYEKTGRPVVVLVDGCDKPLVEVDDNKTLFNKNRAVLMSFLANLKTMDRYLRFAFLTGITSLTPESIYSGLNNIVDISIMERYADICGWTEEELLGKFTPAVKELSVQRHEQIEDTVSELRSYYGGYRFNECGSQLFNPYSIMRALETKSAQPYCFSTDMSMYLAKRVKRRDLELIKDTEVLCDEDVLAGMPIGYCDPVPLLFQTGYLTIDGCNRRRGRYTLCIPNQEVEMAYSKLMSIAGDD